MLLCGDYLCSINGDTCFISKNRRCNYGREGSRTPKKVEKLHESVNGVKNLLPDKLEVGKSLNGIENLAPQNLQSSMPDLIQDPVKVPSEQENSADKDKK